MDKQAIIESIRQEKEYLNRQFGVEEIGLFGSYARNEQNEHSDIDVLVKLNRPSYKALMGVYAYLEKKLNKKIDLIRKGPHLSGKFMDMILKDVIYV
jgi:predicted nucleotidyltransferase